MKARFLCILSLFFSINSWSQDRSYNVYLDLDNNVSTGCDVNQPEFSTVFNGIDGYINIETTGSPAVISQSSYVECSGGTFSSGTPVVSSALGFNTGDLGEDVFEAEISTIDLGVRSSTQARLYFSAGTAQSRDLVTTNDNGGNIYVGVAFPIPAFSLLAAVILGLLCLLVAKKFINNKAYLLSVVFIYSSVAWAMIDFVIDGQTGDWVGMTAAANDPTGDQSGAGSYSDITRVYAHLDQEKFVARMDIVDVENQAPVANDTAYSLLEDGSVVITVTGSDMDGDPLTFAEATPPSNGTLTSFVVATATSATATYTPDQDYFGADSFTFVANDGQSDSVPATVNLTIDPVNDEPSFVAPATISLLKDIGAFSQAWVTSIDFGAANESGQTGTFTVLSNDNPALFSVQPSIDSNGVISFTTAADSNGIANLMVQLQDDGGTANGGDDTSPQVALEIDVVSVNDPPSFTAGPNQNIFEDAGAQTVMGWATGISAGPPDEAGQVLTFNILNNTNAALFSTGPAVNAAGDLTYTTAPDANGTATITLNLQDDGGTANGGNDTSPSQSFDITVTAVNDAPSFTSGGTVNVNEDTGAYSASWATGLSAGPADEAGQTLSFNITNNTNAALFSVAPSLDSSGALSFTLLDDVVGSATISVEIMDDGGTANGGVDTSASQDFIISVNGVNDEPSFTAGPNQTVLEDSGAQSVVGWATGISAGPADESGQVLTFNIVNNTNPALFSAGPSVSASGELTYTPAVNANGTATITLNLMDDGGTANGGDDTSPNQSFDITVTGVNDAPTFTSGADITVLEDSSMYTGAGWATGISPGPSDESGQTVSFNITTNTNSALFSVQPAVASNGTITFTPAANAFGSATITLELMDDGGTANGGVDTSATQSFDINVTPVNDPPTFSIGANQSVPAGSGAQSIPMWIMGFNPGPANEAGQMVQSYNVSVLTNQGIFLTPPAVAANGTLTFTPVANIAMATTASVQISVTDNGGTANGGVNTSMNQTFNIEITQAAPALVNDGVFNVTGNVGINVPDGGSDLFANDNFFGGTLDSTTPATTVAGSSVLINATTGSFTYNPAPGYTGADSFTYSVTNGAGTSMATVSLNVSDMIWFINDNAMAGGDGTLTTPFDAISDLESINGNGGATDPGAGDCIFIDTGTGSYSGTLTLENNQVLVGEGAMATIPSVCGITMATNSLTLPTTSGTRPSVSSANANAIVLASGNTIRGLNVGNTGSGTGITGNMFGVLTVSEVSITGTGSAIDLATGTAAITLDSINSTNSVSEGVDLDAVSGTFTVTNDTSVTNSAAAGIDINSSTGTFTFGSLNINNSSSNATGLFASNVTALNINTDNDLSGGAINSGTGRAVDIDNSSLDISLTSVSTSGGTLPGIDLITTTGNFTVTGNGGDTMTLGGNGSGGTIGSKTGGNAVPPTTGVGVVLNNAQNVTLTSMTLRDFTNWGIYGQTVNNFNLLRSRVDSTGTIGTSVADDEGAILFNNLTGSASVQYSVIEDGLEDNIRVVNNSGTLNRLTVSNSRIGLNSNASGNDGILFESRGTAMADISVLNNTFNGSRGDTVQCNAIDTSSMDCVIQDNTFNNTHGNVVSGGGGVTISGSGSNITMTYNVSGTSPGSQTFTSPSPGLPGNPITVNFVGGAGMAVGTISNNTIGSVGVTGSGSLGGSGMLIGTGGTIVHNSTVNSNIIREIKGFAGVDIINNANAMPLTTHLKVDADNNNILLSADGTNNFTLSAINVTVSGAGTETSTLCLDLDNNTLNNNGAPFSGSAVTAQVLTPSSNVNWPGYVPGATGANGQFPPVGCAGGAGTASTNLGTFLTGQGNVLTNGPFPVIPGSGVDASFSCNNTGNLCP